MPVFVRIRTIIALPAVLVLVRLVQPALGARPKALELEDDLGQVPASAHREDGVAQVGSAPNTALRCCLCLGFLIVLCALPYATRSLSGAGTEDSQGRSTQQRGAATEPPPSHINAPPSQGQPHTPTRVPARVSGCAIEAPADTQWLPLCSGRALILKVAKGAGVKYMVMSYIYLKYILRRRSVQDTHTHTLDCVPENLWLRRVHDFSSAFAEEFFGLGTTMVYLLGYNQIAQQRTFYLFLRNGILLDFENASPLADPLFIMLILSLMIFFLSIIFGLHCEHGASVSEELLRGAKQAVSEFVLPSGLFVGFMWVSYDIEASLLPLSKYFESSPLYARRALSQMPYIHDRFVAKAVKQLCKNDNANQLPEDAAGVVCCIADYAMQLEEEATTNPTRIPARSRWHLMAGRWPTSFLRHVGQVGQDEEDAWICGVLQFLDVLLWYSCIFTIIIEVIVLCCACFTNEIADPHGVFESSADALIARWLLFALYWPE